MSRLIILAVGTSYLLAVSAAVATGDSLWRGDEFDLNWWTVDGGGAMWATEPNAEFELSGTIGQPDAGVMTGGEFELTGGFWFGARAAPPICTGDLNCDGLVSFGDINPFVLYLSNFTNWQAAHMGCNPRNGDINGDSTYGQGSFGDINPFVALMTQCGSGCTCSGLP
jgi:hypothetical protein